MDRLAALSLAVLAALALGSLAEELRRGSVPAAAGRLFAAAALLYVARAPLADGRAARAAGRLHHGAMTSDAEPGRDGCLRRDCEAAYIGGTSRLGSRLEPLEERHAPSHPTIDPPARHGVAASARGRSAVKLLAALALGLLALLAALSLVEDLRGGLLLPAAGHLFAAAALLYVARASLADAWAARPVGRRLHGAGAPAAEPISSAPAPRR